MRNPLIKKTKKNNRKRICSKFICVAALAVEENPRRQAKSEANKPERSRTKLKAE